MLWGNTSGAISVNTENGCGASSPSYLSVAVETIPAAAQAITGPDTVCQGQGSVQYSIPAIPGATIYLWTLPSGASITQGQGTNVVEINFSSSALSGDITAAGSNDCGTGTDSSIYVHVLICTGMDGNRLLSQVSVYPNPVHGFLNVSIRGAEKALRMQITDVSGQTLCDESLSNLPADYTRQIDVSRFAKGVYMIRLTNDSRLFVSKFTVD